MSCKSVIAKDCAIRYNPIGTNRGGGPKPVKFEMWVVGELNVSVFGMEKRKNKAASFKLVVFVRGRIVPILDVVRS